MKVTRPPVLLLLWTLVISGCGGADGSTRYAVTMTFTLSAGDGQTPSTAVLTGWVDRDKKTSEMQAGDSAGTVTGTVRRDHDKLVIVKNGSQHERRERLSPDQLGGNNDLPDPLNLLLLVKPGSGEARSNKCVRPLLPNECVDVTARESAGAITVTYAWAPFGSVGSGPQFRQKVEAVYTACDADIKTPTCRG